MERKVKERVDGDGESNGKDNTDKISAISNDVNIKTATEVNKVKDKNIEDIRIVNKLMTSPKHDELKQVDSTTSGSTQISESGTYDSSVVEVHCTGEGRGEHLSILGDTQFKDSLTVNEHTPLCKELSATSNETRYSSDASELAERPASSSSRRKSSHPDGHHHHHHHRSHRHRRSERRKSRSADRRPGERGESNHRSGERRKSTAVTRKASVRRISHAPGMDKRQSVSAESRKGSSSAAAAEYHRRQSRMQGPYMSPGLGSAYSRPGAEIFIASLIILVGLVLLLVSFCTGQGEWMVVGAACVGLGSSFLLLGLCWYFRKPKHEKTPNKSDSNVHGGTQNDLTAYTENSVSEGSPGPHRV